MYVMLFLFSLFLSIFLFLLPFSFSLLSFPFPPPSLFLFSSFQVSEVVHNNIIMTNKITSDTQMIVSTYSYQRWYRYVPVPAGVGNGHPA
jgi:hypothetical protein